jgi:hypothetical protein
VHGEKGRKPEDAERRGRDRTAYHAGGRGLFVRVAAAKGGVRDETREKQEEDQLPWHASGTGSDPEVQAGRLLGVPWKLPETGSVLEDHRRLRGIRTAAPGRVSAPA